MPSVSRHEESLTGLVEGLLRAPGHLDVVRRGTSVVARTTLGRPQRLLLAGHLDTVPPADGVPVRAVVHGDALTGLGAVDMKGGLAVMLALVTTLTDPAVDLTLVCYGCEEVARDENELPWLLESAPELFSADAAILGEPTGGVVEAGCQGTLRLRVTVRGRRAHTARPWRGVNAIHRLGSVLDAVTTWPGREVEIDGCRYVEQLQAVAVEGGIAANVVPDRAVLTVNGRFAPDRDVERATLAFEEVMGRALAPALGDAVEVVDAAPAAAPALEHPLLAATVAATGAAPRAKVGWTDVATLAAFGIPATNFGPGDPLMAHAAEETVTRAELDQAWRVLTTVVSRS